MALELAWLCGQRGSKKGKKGKKDFLPFLPFLLPCDAFTSPIATLFAQVAALLSKPRIAVGGGRMSMPIYLLDLNRKLDLIVFIICSGNHVFLFNFFEQSELVEPLQCFDEHSLTETIAFSDQQ